ncbi:MAG: DUF4347 domain-containing protein [Synechococcales cyanobacterium T60_A2020_003]|nr:DUF4347 domain-containing protein [Synechococcales cyanobacterium T60_A2020_003]
MAAKSIHTLVVVDSGLDNYQHLAAGVLEGAEVLVLDQHQDGIAQITQFLQTHQDIHALHILSHATPGVLALGTTHLSLLNLGNYAQSLQAWSNTLSSQAEIWLYGCQLAATDLGRSLVQRIAHLTQPAIAASDTLTGVSALGGDWNLAVQTAPIKTRPALAEHTMATYAAVMALFDWSDPGIDWPQGTTGTNTYTDVGGTGVDVTITINTTNGVTFGQAGGIITPNDVASLQGGDTTVVEALHVTMNAATLQDSTTTTVEFSQAVDGVAFGIYDIDENFAAEGWQDEVEILGFFGNTVVQPTLTASNNATYTINGDVATGVGNADNTGANSGQGTLNVSFDSPITSYQLIYRNGAQASADPGEQGIAILSNIFFNDPGTNLSPDTDNVRQRVNPGETRQLNGLTGSDPDGTIARFRITSVPPSGQGTLFLGDPANGGTELQVGDRIRANRIDDVFFQASNNFSGTTFEYAAIDNDGLQDPTPATVRLQVGSSTTNERPETDDVSKRIEPDTVNRLRGLNGHDPDGTVEQFRIETLPPSRQGTLFLGNPDRNGTPVSAGQRIDAGDIGSLFFQSTPRFSGTSFEYAAIDNQGASDRTPAQISITSGSGSSSQCRRGDTIRGTNRNDRLSGADGRDQIFGKAGDDRLRGRLCDDLVVGRAGNDNLLGDAGNDTLIGNDGNDSLDGASGADFGQGGKGSDRISGGAGDDTLFGKRDNDEITGDAGDDVIFGGRGNDRLQGGDGDDAVEGKGGSDRIRGDKGNDTLFGNFGDDTIAGRIGDDRINGGSGDDTLGGDAGSDRIRGENGDDAINGGAGSDRLKGNSGDDRIRGAAGSDIANGGKDDDFVSGRNGDDRLRGASGDDIIRGNKGEDILSGNRGQDRVNGRQGDDILVGGAGEDLLTGGKGTDVIVYRRIRDGGESGDRIRNFKIGQDLIDLSELFDGNQFASKGAFGRYVSLTQVGSITQLDINVAGEAGDDVRTFALLRGVNADNLGRSSFIL